MEKRALIGTVVVVDDDSQSLRAIRAILAANGFHSLCASSGAEAFELLQHRADEVDLVLTDLYMPGVSGMDLLMHVRQRYPELPTIVLTGNADVPSAVAAIRAGGFDYLRKPVESGGP